VYANYSIWGWVGASNNNNGPASGLHTLKCGPAMHRDPMPCFPSLSESVWVSVQPMQLIDSVGPADGQLVTVFGQPCGQPSFDLLLLILCGRQPGLAESNGCLPPGLWLTSPAANNRDQRRNPTLGNRVWACWWSVGHCLWSAVCGQPSFDLLLLIYADDGRPALICCDKWWQFVHTDRCFAGLYTWNVARDHDPKMQDRNPRDHIIINFYLSKKFR